jgi:hypothetical protein
VVAAGVAAEAVLGAQVVWVLAAQAREQPRRKGVRALRPEELTRVPALEASAREDDPATPAGRLTPTLIGIFRESHLPRDRAPRRLRRELTDKAQQQPTRVTRSCAQAR